MHTKRGNFYKKKGENSANGKVTKIRGTQYKKMLNVKMIIIPKSQINSDALYYCWHFSYIKLHNFKFSFNDGEIWGFA